VVFDRFRAYLSQPYPFNSESKHYLQVILVFAVFVAGFLMVFQPFGIDDMDRVGVVLISCSFGLVTLFSLLIFLFLTKLFPQEFNDDRWTLGKEIAFGIFNFFMVGNGNYLFVRYGWYSDIMAFDYGSMMFSTFTVGFFPYLFMLLTQHMSMLRRNLKEAAEMTVQLKDHHKNEHLDRVISGENEGEEIAVHVDDLLFIASSGNYIEIVLQHDGHPRKEVIRSTLSNVEEVFSDVASVFRCHRTHLVNLDQVAEVRGNSQGYRLRLEGWSDDIPVARTKNKVFREALRANQVGD
jgi:hypothetical protein